MQKGDKMQYYLCSMSEFSFLPFSNSNSLVRCSVILSDIRLVLYSSSLLCCFSFLYLFYSDLYQLYVCAYISKCI